MTIRQGKGRKDRVVTIGERAVAWVEKYLADARPRLVVEPDSGTLFLTAEGESFSLDHRTPVAHERDPAPLPPEVLIPRELPTAAR